MIRRKIQGNVAIRRPKALAGGGGSAGTASQSAAGIAKRPETGPAKAGAPTPPRGGQLLDRLVQIHGLDGPIVASGHDQDSEDQGPLQANGVVGIAIKWRRYTGTYVVCTFDLLHLEVPAVNLGLYDFPPLAAGGFDLCWPYEHNKSFFEFSSHVNSTLIRKNWCLVQVFKSAREVMEAASGAKRRDYHVPKEELIVDFMGRRGSGKVSFMNPLDLTGSEDAARTAGELRTGLEAYDQDISKLFAFMGPMTWDSMGFNSYGRTEGMSWVPFSGSREQLAMTPEPLDDDDVEEDGVVERHLQFIRRRKLCFLYMVDNEGGKLTLTPRKDLKMEPVTMPIQKGRLLIFRCDLMAFSFQPQGQHLTLLSWVLEAPPKIEIGDIVADSNGLTQVLGIAEGPAFPKGLRAHIMSGCCFTGGSTHSLEEAAMMYMVATDGHTYVPRSRFDTDLYFAKNGQEDFVPYQTSYHVHGALCDDPDVMSFDFDFFGLSEFEASLMQTCQHKTLEVGYETLYRAGWTRDTIKNKKILSYLGDSGCDWWYTLMLKQFEGQHHGHEGNPAWEAARSASSTGQRLAYTLGLRGECWVVDTACSSGLTAFCTAMFSIKRPADSKSMTPTIACHCVGALAGGTNMVSDASVYVGASGQHMLSAKGRCFTFNGTGDGYARGEGTSMCYVTLSESDRDSELQEACAIGNKVNQDGRSASMTAPNGPSQQLCIKASLREAGVEPHDITASECHGTGTSLGDPIEVGSLRGVQETDDRDDPVILSSSKSNIGHLEANAGTTGLFKCILMSKYGSGLPNCHLYQLNPHLDVSGWPTWMISEASNMMRQTGLVGVSSFGVSGTNSHAEVWAMCKNGPNRAGREKLNMEALKQITVTCPVTLGPIDYLTGEPARTDGSKYKADCLREELESYDVSSLVYDGDYRYRREALEDDDDLVNPPGVRVTINGSWSGWRAFEVMKEGPDGSYVHTVQLGDTRCESFFICVDGIMDYRFYPAHHKAGQHIWVEGPDKDDKSAGKHWIIDGRDGGVPAGTAYQIKFYWGSTRKRVFWEEVVLSEEEAATVPKYEHTYQLIGSWTGGHPETMDKVEGEAGIFEYKARIGVTGEEEFQLCRDFDEQQLIYPEKHGTEKSSVPVRGPDDLGFGKRWLVHGETDELVHIRLEVSDGQVLVSVNCRTMGEHVYESVEGWERHTYELAFSDGGAEPMVMDPEVPGVFHVHGRMGRKFNEKYRGICEFFNITVDGDRNFGFFPDVACASSGECIVWGPEPIPQEQYFLIKSWQTGAGFEITLDLRALDRRKVVTWVWDTPQQFNFVGGMGITEG